MILNFAIEGFTSFNERQEISFTAFNKQRIKIPNMKRTMYRKPV